MAKKKSRSKRARSQNKPAGPVERGQAAFHRGDYDATIAAWEEALAQNPSDDVRSALAEVHFRRGVTRLHRDGQREEGRADLDTAAGLVPGDARYNYHLGLAYHLLGDLETALTAYRLALAADPPLDRAAPPAVLAMLEQGRDPVSSAAWKALSREQQDEFSHLARLIAGEAPAAPAASTTRPARVWHALAAIQAGAASPTTREVLWETAQDDDEPRPVRALAAYALGVQAMRAGGGEEAVAHWEAARRLGLDTPALDANLRVAYYRHAEEAMEEERWTDAAPLARQALDLAPGDRAVAALAATAYFYAGHAHAQAGRWRQAVAHLEAARELGENSRDLVQDLALAHERTENYEQAAELWREVVRRRPRKASAPDALTPQQVAILWGHVSECYRKAGDTEEAIKTLRNAIKNDPSNVELRLELVDGLIADERFQAAAGEIDRILEQDADNVGALVRKARVAQTTWYPGVAIPIWRRVLSSDPNHLEARESLAELLERVGDTLMRMGSVDQALERYTEALSYTPDDPLLHLSRAHGCFLKEDLDAARGEIETAIELDPDDLVPYIAAVDLVYHQSRPEEAAWIVTRAQEGVESGLPATLFLDLAEVAIKYEMPEAAAAHVERAEQAAAGDADALTTIASYYLDKNQDGLAATYLDQALRVDPEHGLANTHMGAIYAAAGEMREANRHWRQARRTARKTDDRELLVTVEELRSYFEMLFDRIDQGLPPPPLGMDWEEFGYDDDDDDW